MLYFNIKNIILEILVLNSIVSSILVIIAKNPVISVIFLISLVLNAALYLIVKGLSFMGISYILIYLGAIIVLFLFVIMMINIKLTDILEIGYHYTKNIPLALTVSGLFLYIFLNILPSYLNNPAISLDSSIIYSIIKEMLLLVNSFFYYITNLFFEETNNQILSLNYLVSDSSDNNGILNIPLLGFNNWPETNIMGYNHIISVAYSLYTYGAFWFLLTSFILLLAMIAPIFISKK